MDKDKIWQQFIERLNKKISVASYNAWFKDLKLLTINDNDIVLITPYAVQKNHIKENYLDEIEDAFQEITGVVHNVIICLDGEYQEKVPLTNDIINNKDEKKILDFVETKKTNLNPKYTFDNFVVGDSNRFAFSSCLSVAQNPGKLYNPLFLYGKSGLG